MDPYSTLDIKKTSDIDKIEEAYRQKVKTVHPDTGGSTEEFIRVRKAYKKLLNMDSTDAYTNIYPAQVKYISFDYIRSNNVTDLVDIFNRNLPSDISGSFEVNKNETILEAAERTEHQWPFSCRGGACSNCAVKVIEGDVRTPKYSILTDELLQEGYQLSCLGTPLTSEVKLIYGVRDHKDIQNLLLPSRD